VDTNTQSQRLAGKIALVTGGTTGIGLATAKRFIAEGAYVFITGRRQDQLDSALRELGPNAAAVQGDVSALDDLDRLFAVIKERKGRLDILFANAGVGELAPLGQITEAHFDNIFGVNVKGTVFTVQKALPLMGRGASIVINASMVSILGPAGLSIYAASKAALRSLARTWSVDLKDRGIRVNVVSPGVVITPGYKTMFGTAAGLGEQFEAQAAATAPAGRPGTPEEIAAAVVFLASDESSYVNATELFVDGGAAQI
jgi:NAD(P)-dependent dehydrogenase (short-subunit alcohol dehydrogenase family)